MTKFYRDSLPEILKAIVKFEKTKFIIGIDGPGGSGKSTFANELAEKLTETEIIHMDDFYLPEKERTSLDSNSGIGIYFDWPRLESQVLIPFSENKEIKFQRYDWESGTLKERQIISENPGLIIEGVYSLRKELLKYYDLKIWIDSPYEIRLKRGLERDGIEMKEYWLNVWMKQEDEYVRMQNPSSYADFIIRGF